MPKAKRVYIVTPTGDFNKESTHRLLPRFRHKHREPSGFIPAQGGPANRIRIAA